MIGIVSKDYTTGVTHFVCDTTAEIAKLPTINSAGKDNLSTIQSCVVGSTATVTETSERYILNGNQNKWLLLKNTAGGGSSEEWATTGDIDKMFQ
ncbi:MAG: hypothetical protein ACI4KR_09765 [Ruminiclostridium sp.]